LPSSDLFQTVSIVDVDSHVTEPPDLWTARISVAKWGDKVPHVRWHAASNQERWFVGDRCLSGVGAGALAGWHDYFPSYPPTMGDVDPGAWNPNERLLRLDEYGIHTQLLYPNVLGVHSAAFLALKQPKLMYECVRAYNDFLTDFCSVDPARLIPLTMVPFWDIDQSIAELERCIEFGHRGLIMAARFDAVGYPPLASGHWDPLLDAAQALGQSVNFHIGFSALSQSDLERSYGTTFDQRTFVKDSVLMFVSNVGTIVDLIVSGLCDRFPRLNFVSVESGAGYLAYLLEAMDWQWQNAGCSARWPSSALPSEIFRRQIYGTYWFEVDTLGSIESLSQNIMFETDYPHPTSLSPGPASSAPIPLAAAERSLRGLADPIVRRLLHDNAARVYRLN
jgi:predicted TIM-barrel fold metal-dependent hydrolase